MSDDLLNYLEQIAELNPHARLALSMAVTEIRRLNAELEGARRETASVWRCAIGDAVGAIDVLCRQWESSKRKQWREAAVALTPVLDRIWAARDPAATDYKTAAANGKKLIGHISAMLDPDAATGCADDQAFASVSGDNLRAALGRISEGEK